MRGCRRWRSRIAFPRIRKRFDREVQEGKEADERLRVSIKEVDDRLAGRIDALVSAIGQNEREVG